jgi:hypothetical protein
MSAFGTKRTSQLRSPMSAFGVKRTSDEGASMSAFDPTLTLKSLSHYLRIAAR